MPGLEGMGVVHKCGPGATKFKEGAWAVGVRPWAGICTCRCFIRS